MVLAIILSFLAGVAIVVSRSINAELATNSSVIKSAFYNFVVGLVVSIIVALVAGFSLPQAYPNAVNWWIYLGGVMGALTIVVSNIVVTKISALSVTLLMFVGQVFAGIIIDIVLTKSFSLSNVLGGVFVAIGLAINLIADR